MQLPRWLKYVFLTLGGLSLLAVIGVTALFGYWKFSTWYEMRKIQTAGSSESVNVIMISVDGGRPESLVNGGARNILSLRERGAYTFRARTIEPSWTAPAHLSAATGLTPEHHGLKVNRFEYMSAAQKASIINRYKTGKLKTVADYIKINREMKTVVVIVDVADFQQEIREFLGTRNLDEFRKVPGDSRAIGHEAAQWLYDKEPVMLFVHFKAVDEAGHKYGWMSKEQFAAVREVDEGVGIILRALEKSPKRKNTYLVLFADHGGHNKVDKDGLVQGDHGTTSDDDMNIPWIIFGPGIRRGYEIRNSVNICDTAATVLHILGIPIPLEMDGKPVFEAFK